MMLYTVNTFKTRLFEAPSDADQAQYKSHGSELLYNEFFETAGQDNDGWVYGRSLSDGYEGWIARKDLKEAPSSRGGAQYVVILPKIAIYKEPDLKAQTLGELPFAMRGDVNNLTDKMNGFIYEQSLGGWLHEAHIVDGSHISADNDRFNDAADMIDQFCAFAALFYATPYIYGGRSAKGVDCSALIQLPLAAMGVSVPRDSTPQSEYMDGARIGKANMCFIKVENDNPESLRKGDIVFFPGHVGVMLSPDDILHASSRVMHVTSERIDFVAGYYQEHKGQGITAIRRIINNE